ncbi:S-adenosyl-L-methionine-dependent methyltransferases superfamily protein isoform X2 [Tasmannia lanceolata]|uniref:S-adenosyl-L-methionine-dependent methyltransferases superfamily protein isoform X2 n=1 Tax=Tasmannia lanceolata TaxID=3420 RepID=UPI00406347D1
MAENERKEKKGKKTKAIPVYGNYKSYYNYRIGHDLKEDPRLAVLKKEWFEGKDCFDIGCNQAKKFLCQSILGVDIDAGLIENAYWNLRRTAKMECASCRSVEASESNVSNRVNGLEEMVSASVNKETMHFPIDSSPAKEGGLVDRVSFHKENIVESLDACSEKYDTILCLSVTKWIHLNWGDDGLITLFVKIWRLLRLGGILILEPQPWESYRRKHLVSEAAAMNYHSIVLKPALFQEILLDKIGFRTVENITDNLPGSVAGFNRPIFLFRK